VDTVHREAAPEKKRAQHGKPQQAGENGEGLVGQRLLGVHAHPGGHHHPGQQEQAGLGETPGQPVSR